MKKKYILSYPKDQLFTESEKRNKHTSKISRRFASENTTIGLWDLGAWLAGELYDLVKELNNIQDSFNFYVIKAAVPSGIISHPQLTLKWYDKNRLIDQKEVDLKYFNNNLISNYYYPIAEKIRKKVNVDFIFGISPSMVAGIDDEGAFYNHFSSFEKNTILGSSYQLRDYSIETKIPFKNFLVCIIVSQLLTAMFYPKIGYHLDSGCLFDYDKRRVLIKNKAKDLKIEDTCMNLIPDPYRQSTTKILDYYKAF